MLYEVITNFFGKGLPSVCRMLLFGLLFAPVGFLGVNAEAAQLSFSPSEVSVELAPGESKVVPATVALEGASQAGFSVIFRLSQVGGTFPSQNSSPPTTLLLDSSHNSSQTAIKISYNFV